MESVGGIEVKMWTVTVSGPVAKATWSSNETRIIKTALATFLTARLSFVHCLYTPPYA